MQPRQATDAPRGTMDAPGTGDAHAEGPAPARPAGAGGVQARARRGPHRRFWFWTLGCLALVGAMLAVKHGRFFIIPRALAEVEPGLYRSGQMRGWPLERTVESRGIRTILRLNSMRRDDPRLLEENEVVARNGIDYRYIHMNGFGTAPFDVLDQAADFVADRSRRPLLFHCAAGDARSSAVMAVYRMRSCGWSWKRTWTELQRYGIDREDSPELTAHLEQYYRERIEPYR